MDGVHLTDVIELFYFQRVTLRIPYYAFLPTAIPSLVLEELSGRWTSLGTALRHERTIDAGFALDAISMCRSVKERMLLRRAARKHSYRRP
jgi:hypothetical protein